MSVEIQNVEQLFVATPSQFIPVPGDMATWEVTDAATGQWLGRVARIGGQWVPGGKGRRRQGTGYIVASRYRIVTAGPCVKFDLDARYETLERVCDAVVDVWTSDDTHTIGEHGLTPFQRDVLDFETNFAFVKAANKIPAIMDLFPGVNQTRYYQLLAEILELEAALAYQPLTVNRLRTLAAKKAAKRGALHVALRT